MLVRNIFKLVAITLFLGLSPLSYANDYVVPYGQNAAVGKYANINGIKFYYEIYGSGEPLILIHGNGSNIAGMTAQIEYFSKKYKVIVADSRGHGKSGLGTDHLTYEQMAEDWNGLLDYLNIKKAKIFGWSDGGILGLLLAINHPDKICKMAIMGTNLRPDETAIEPWAKPLLEDAAKLIDEMAASSDVSEDWALQKQLLNLVVNQPNIEVKSLHHIKVPVLVIAGDRDVIRGEHTLEIFQNLKYSQLAILPGHTHYAPARDPDIFNDLLNYFFEEFFEMPSSRAIMEQP